MFLAGGSRDFDAQLNSNDAYILDWTSNEWTRLPGMNVSRSSHSCGLTARGHKVVVVGGNMGQGGEDFTEIFDLETMTWTQGPPSPHPTLDYASTVPHGDTFLLVGGFLGWDDGTSSSIYEFDWRTDAWVIREEKLEMAKEGHVALGVYPGDMACP